MEVYDTPYVTMKIEDSIISGIYKNVTIDLEDAKQIALDRLAFLNGRKYPAFIDLRNVKLVTKEARIYFSKETGTDGLIAIAILIGSRLTVFTANLYMKLDKPKVPTMAFRTRAEAMKWLASYTCNVDVETTIRATIVE